MKEKGNFQITRMNLIIIIAAIVVIALIIVLAVILGGNNKKQPANEQQNIIANESVENNVKNETVELEQPTTKTLSKIEIGKYAGENSTIDGKVPCYYNPVIPYGFKAICSEQDSTIDVRAKWGEQNAYLFGLVIEDQKGNQFVWIPVENMNLLKATDWQKNAPKETIDPTYVEPISGEQDDYNKMLSKVQKYGGFYIGRYETGDLTAENERTAMRNSDSIAIRKYLNSYNYIPYKITTTTDKREIIGAYELSEKFASMYGYKDLTTTLMYGAQWDSVLRFIVSDEYNVNDSLKWGNYSTTKLEYGYSDGSKNTKASGETRLLMTGASEQTKAKNIYDIAGNLYEWTKETAGKDVRIVRGGSYVVAIGQLAASRYAYNYNTANNAIGFRVCMYLD